MNAFLLVCLICLASPSMSAAQKLLFAIRVDDVLSRNTSVAYRSIVPFQDTVEAHGGKVTWAVIPGRLTETTNASGVLSRELRATIARGHEVCMHGLTHVCPRCQGTGHEMYCATYGTHFPSAVQQKLIDDGVMILRDSVGVTPQLFVPPGHAADSTTFIVCRARGFAYASTTLETRAAIAGGLFNVAPHSEFTWQMTESDYAKNLHAALAEIRTTGVRNGYYCILLHDYFIRLGYANGIVLKWMGEVIDSVKREYAADVKFVTLTEAARVFSQPAGVRPDARTAAAPSALCVLMQNYPNPFNPQTRITFRLREQSVVRLVIRDVLGRSVAALIEGVREAGVHDAFWNAAPQMPSGAYFYTLEARPAAGAAHGAVDRQTKQLYLLK